MPGLFYPKPYPDVEEKLSPAEAAMLAQLAVGTRKATKAAGAR
jgi:hypothetical protein